MSVRIIENFWNKVSENENLIRRCFLYHFKRHPDPEGIDASYNNLLVKLEEYGVFDRFDLQRLVIAAGAEGVLKDEELTPEVLKEIGINVNKKWEQFIFKWVEQIVNREYNRNGRYSRTFLRGEELSDYGIPQGEKTSWINDVQDAKNYEEKFNTYDETDRRGRLFPPTFSNRYKAGEEGFDDQSEALSASELRDKILSRLTGKNDRAIFELMEKGLLDREIGAELGFSKQYVSSVLKKVRAVTAQLCPEMC